MLFNTIEYWLFFAAVLLIFYSLPFKYGRLFLLLASYVFYANWSASFVLLIIGSTVVDYLLGLVLAPDDGRPKRGLLTLSLLVNLGCLGFFKYYNLLASSAAALAGRPVDSFALNIVLPVGISFYTFASLSYTIDVYRGRMKPVRNLADYALFVSFFPHLPAGPIVRARQFISQIWTWNKPRAVVVQSGLVLILSGLVKKMIFADRFAIVSDGYFNNLAGNPGWLSALSGTVAFWMQIYFDFSGYTDIARGCAKLLGFEFPLNFVRPYLAPNITQFWQRWHISLGRWVHDYVFRPLTKRGQGRLMLARNTFITMLLVGLWHGASWQFVLWGAYLGLLLIVHRVFVDLKSGTRFEAVIGRRVFVPFVLAFAMLMYMVPMVLFRTRTFADAALVFRSMFNFAGAYGDFLLTPVPCALIAISFILAILEERHRLIERMATASIFVQIAGYSIVFLSLELFSVTEQRIPFIYFQF